MSLAAFLYFVESHRGPLRAIIARVSCLCVLCNLCRPYNIVIVDIHETIVAAQLAMRSLCYGKSVRQLHIRVEALGSKHCWMGAIDVSIIHGTMQTA
jgi:hypothetical protein